MARRKQPVTTPDATDVTVPDMTAEQSQQISDKTREAYVQAAEQQGEGAVPATETSAPQASVLNEQQYLGLLAAQLIAPNHHAMEPEHILPRIEQALAKAELLLATLKARYGQ